MKIHTKIKGIELLNAGQKDPVIGSSKAVLYSFALLVITGCVSQQSALNLEQANFVQPTPVGVQLADNNLGQNASATLVAQQIVSTNIPVRAPRPSAIITNAQTASAPLQQQVATVTSPKPVAPTNLSSQVQQQAAAQISQQAVTPNVQAPTIQSVTALTQNAGTQNTGTLAIAETQAQSPTANVIEQATSLAPSPNTAIPAKKPAISGNQLPAPVEVASLSPSLDAAPTTPQIVKKKSFFEQVFTPKEKTPRPVANVKKPKVQKTSRAASRIETASLIAKTPKNAPKIIKPAKPVINTRKTNANSANALPGVKSNSEIFGIKDEGPLKTKVQQKTTQVASVGSFGRLSPNGLRVQHSKVQVACLKPGVLRILKQVERRYGKKPIITSGYRSPKGNRRAGGARNSQHIFCKAVDIQVEGVSKWKLAKYIRTLPGRGGVGTYCRTKSVHFDIGSKRDWHHPCRKSSKRKRKKT